MCGIGGYISWKYNSKPFYIDAMLQSLKHRGPDGSSVNESEYGYILHTRLSIIDTSNNGLQPFSVNDGQIVTAHNGEIYNYKCLKKCLPKEINYVSNTDSEVIPHYYFYKGVKSLVKDLEGMFSMSILDKEKKKLYLIRDQFGIKPLYYHISSEGICFGSEIKAVLTMFPDLKREIDEQYIYDFLSLGYIVEPQTFYNQLFCVPAGSILEYDIQTNTVKVEYYVLPYKKGNINVKLKQLDDTLKRVIQEQSIADVPMASFLSGGVDSTLVSTYYAESNDDPRTFTVSFGAESRDESNIALKTAEYLKTKHQTIKPIIELSHKELDVLIRHFDQPFGDLSMISTNILCREVSKHVKVALSGDGGDEFVAGYNKFKLLWLLNAVPQLLRTPIKMVSSKILSKDSKYWRLVNLLNKSFADQNFELSSYLRDGDLQRFFNNSYKSPKRHFKWVEGYSTLQNTTLNQLNTSLLSKMLPKVDRISMLNNVEVRVPLLDQKLTSILFRLRDSLKLNFKTSKIIYKKLVLCKLPIYKKNKKVGFDFDHSELKNLGLIEHWIEHLKEIDNDSRFWKIFSKNEINKWITRYLFNKNNAYSLQSQMQVIFHLYVIAKWFEWNEL
jgi:asparagine synthase (glutamine-hydrolysing)